MGYELSPYALLLAGSCIADIAAAATVCRGRGGTGRPSLCIVFVAAAVWSLAYALELAAPVNDQRELWGMLKYVGTTVLPPAWLIFALQYTGRLVQPRPRLLAALAIEPLVVLSLLAYPETRDLIRSYPSDAPQSVPVPRLGIVYWAHFTYTNALVLSASTVLIITVMRASRLYWRQNLTLVIAVSLPLLANAMASLEIPPFEVLDPSPIAVSLSAWVLVAGVLRFQLLDLRPVARALVLEMMRDGVVVVDAQNRVVDLNPAAQQLLGGSAAATIGASIDALLGEPATAAQTSDPGLYELGPTTDYKRELELTVTPLPDTGGVPAGRVLVFHDVSERRALERSLRRLAYTDHLTELPNRLVFSDRLNQALVMATRHRVPLAVFFLDLDRFKIINDSLGHEIGDRVLASVARRLRQCLRDADTLARLGGDEFAVLLPEISNPRDAHHVADKLLTTLSAPHFINTHELTVDASIGIALFPRDGSDVRSLLRSADAAMYRAKARGRGRIEAFAPALGEQAVQQQQLAVELRRGLRAGQLQLAFQPYEELSTGRTVGFEALVRWNHPRGGLLAPASFLRLAEQTGLMEAVDRWVLKEACGHARGWESPLGISVNVSPASLRATDLSSHLADILAETGLAASRLTLELSERTLFDDDPDVLTILADLAAAGVGLALDDFGAGYISLGHLERLPVTQVKIDRSLVLALSDGNGDSPIVSAVISFAHALGLSVTAEGIEQPHQLKRLVSLGCEYGQGFLLGRPQMIAPERATSRLPPTRATP